MPAKQIYTKNRKRPAILNSADEDAVRLLELEELNRMQLAVWRKHPLIWLKERFGEDPLNFQWSKRNTYIAHQWDGDKDPLARAWNALAAGNWVGIEAATGCHAKGTELIMYDGSIRKVEDICVGDRLMGDDSTPREVLSLARGRQTMYRIIPTKGEPFEVNEDHILSLKKTTTGDKYKNKLDIVNVSIKDYLGWNNHDKHLYKLYRVGVSFRPNKLPIMPYLMGLWLGDGTKGLFNITTADKEIVNFLSAYASVAGLNMSVNNSGGKRCPTYALNNGKAGLAGKTNWYSKYLELAVINGEKRIPSIYLTGSRKQRLKLLAGLIDSDGCNDGCGCYCITTKWKGLQEDILFLARSLGFAAYGKDRYSRCQGMTEDRLYHGVIISGNLYEVPVLLPRKKIQPRLQKKRVDVTGFSLEKLDTGEYYGFELDRNHLYLLKDFTVTHNTSKTYMASRIVMWFLDVYPDSLVVTSAPKQAQLTLHMWAEISKAFYKFKKIRPKANLYNLRLVVEDDEEKEDGRSKAQDYDENNPNFSKSWHAVGFVSGVGSEEQSATKAQGFHREFMLIIAEEAAGMPNPVMTAFKNTCTGGFNVILGMGNPDSQLDPLHQFCMLTDVKNFRVSALDYPNIVEQREIIKGAVTQKSIDRRASEYGVKSAMYQSRVRGISPSQGVDSLIQKDWIDQCIDNGLKYDGSWHAVGVDVAQSENGDKAGICWGEGNQLLELQEFQCPNATDLAYNLIMSTEELSENGYLDYSTKKVYDFNIMPGMLGVDAVGVGVATLNALSHAGWEPVPLQGGQWDDVIPQETYDDVSDDYKEKTRKMYKFQGLRSQMYWELREDLRMGNINIRIEDPELLRKLTVELISIKVTYKDNHIAVESKETIRKRLGMSPTNADIVAYWNWVRKGYRLSSGMMPIG